MKYIDPEPLDMACARLLEEIARLSSPESETFAPDRMERLAKSLTHQLKAMADIDMHNKHVRAQQATENYLHYEDLPPPPPEDRERLIQRLEILYNRINAATEFSEIPEQPASPSAGTPS